MGLKVFFVMQHTPTHFNYNNPTGYQLGAAINGFYDQALPLREDPYNTYGRRYMDQQKAKEREILNDNVPENDEENNVTVEDIGTNKTIKDIQRGQSQEPIFRIYNIIANSKYAANNLTGGSRLQWNLGPFLSSETSGTIQVDEQLLSNIVEVAIQPFEIPAGLFNSNDTFYGPVGLFLNCFSAPSLSITDYIGPPNKSNVLRYHFAIKLSPGSRPGRQLCTPVNPVYKFPIPTRVRQSIWEVSFVSPLRFQIPLPLAIYNGITQATNPMIITATTGMVTGDEITIETAPFSSDIYSVTVISPGTFSVPIDATAIPSQGVQIVIMTRIIRMEYRVVSLDSIGELVTSIRSLHFT